MANRLLTHRQRRFVANYLKGMSGTNAALEAYNVKNRESAAVIASENLRKPNILTMLELLAPNGYIFERSVISISTALNATKGVSGLPDHTARLKAAKLGLKLLDDIHR